MKKIIFGILILVLSNILHITAKDISDNIAGNLECKAIERAESTENDRALCNYFAYWDEGFTCPDDMKKLCYGCICHFESGVTIVTRACECH